MRSIFAHSASLSSGVIKGKAEDAAVYVGYFAWEELITRAASHHIQAVMRGEREGVPPPPSRPARGQSPQRHIGRRVQDSLAEQVKIDPKSLGVGQYQNDVDQNRLAAKFTDVVE